MKANTNPKYVCLFYIASDFKRHYERKRVVYCNKDNIYIRMSSGVTKTCNRHFINDPMDYKCRERLIFDKSRSVGCNALFKYTEESFNEIKKELKEINKYSEKLKEENRNKIIFENIKSSVDNLITWNNKFTKENSKNIISEEIIQNLRASLSVDDVNIILSQKDIMT